MLHDTENDIYSFLIAKVEHKSFFDDVKFERRIGYSTEDNKLWKSCLFKFEDIDQEIQIEEIKVFLDNNAKYWTDNFLEIDPMNSDDLNTNNSFKIIESTLTRNIKKIYLKDYTTLRNSVICYFRSNEMFDFDEMYNTLFEKYNPIEMEKDTYTAYVIDKIKNIKENNKFDNQFKINQKIIKAKVKKVYEVNNNIEIKIMDGIENLDEIINSYEDFQTGEKFIKIKTNNEEQYFYGKVVEANASYIIVEPNEGEEERNSADKISIGLGECNDVIYTVGTNVKITYDGTIMESYPAQVKATKIELKSAENFEILFYDKQPQPDIKLHKIVDKNETHKYDYDIYVYDGSVNIRIDGKDYSLKQALLENKIEMKDIIAKANQDEKEGKIEVEMYKDGGSIEYHYENYTIIKCHTVDGNRDVYIGTKDLKLNDVI